MLDPQTSRFWQATLLSGLMDAKSLAACWDAIPPGKRQDPEHIDRRIARQAVHLKGLTLWQAQQLLAGRTAGFKVDRYVLLDLIGQGGMGRVYLAQDTRLNRRVALKILAPERINNPRAIARFQREARVGAQLQHENLVRIYDFGVSNGRYYLVMEYIEGKTIGTLISEQGSIPPATVVRLVRQVALGLEHAHRKGLIHRDVNPYNVLVTRDGTAKLADLGLAIDLADEDRVTRDGALVGTFDYVAPEQARHSHAADIRSDIYSLGCTIYHRFVGHVPFPGASLPEKLYAHQALEPFPLDQLVPGLPQGLIEVVQRMMRKSPDERYATPLQVAQALEPYAGDDDSVGDHQTEAPLVTKPKAETLPASPRPKLAKAGASTKSGAKLDPALGLTVTEPISSEKFPGAAADPSRVPTTVGSTTPVLSPVSDGQGSDPEFPLSVDLGPEPSLSAGLSRPKTRSVADYIALAASSAAAARQLPRSWLWGPFALIVTVMVLVVAVSVANPSRKNPRKVVTQPLSPASANADTDLSKTVPKAEPVIVIRTQGDNVQDIPASNLLDAIQKAIGKDAAVELRNHEPLRLTSDQTLDMLSGTGQLIIRAAPGIEPVIEIDLKGPNPFLTTGSGVHLRLSGLTIVVHYPEGGVSPPPPVIKAAGIARIDRCAFKAAAHSCVQGSRAILSDGGALEVDRSWFEGFDKAVELSVINSTPARIHQTMIVPARGPGEGQPSEWYGWGVKLQFVRAGNPAGKAPSRHLILDHCTMEGAGLLDLATIVDPTPLQVEVKHCLVQADALVACKPNTDLSKQILWKGESNQYGILGHSWIVHSASQGGPALSSDAVTDLDSWKLVEPNDSNPIANKLKYKTDPSARSTPLRPSDFAVEASGPPQTKPGADPEQVGPWSKP
jgi:eukaryotic-like serine/threonine-protein kinase